MGEELADVDSDPTGSDDRDAVADRAVAQQSVGVADDLLVLDAGDVGCPGSDACGDDDVVPAAGQKLRGRHLHAEVHAGSGVREPRAVIADRLSELLLAGYALREPELAADRVLCLEQVDLVAPLDRGERTRQSDPGRAQPRWRTRRSSLSIPRHHAA